MMQRLRLSLPVFFTLACLAGCSNATRVATTAVPASSTSLHGSLHGGQQPIVGATINIYAVGTTGDGSTASSVLASPLTTDSNGFFDLSNKVTCPSPTSLLYLVATGGNPGVAPPFSGAQISLITALGQCGNPSNIQFINVNEVTTVAAIFALSPYMSGLTAIGSGPADASTLADAFTLAWQYADITTGSSPGTGVSSDTVIPTAQINTLANLLSACVNSAGGTAGDTSFCGQLFTLLTPASTAPTDTAMALLNLAQNPGINTNALYTLSPPTAPFQPSLTARPADFSLSVTSPFGIQASASAMSFGPIFVGGTTPVQFLDFTPNQYAYFSNLNLSLVGPNASDFALSGPPDVSCISDNSLFEGYPCVLNVTFTPSAAGVRRAYLIARYSTEFLTNGLIVIPFVGTGTVSAPGPLTISPSTLNMSIYNDPQTVFVTNSNTIPVTITSITAGGSDYTQTNNCGSVLPANSTCGIFVSMHPDQFPANGELDIASSASSTPQTVGLAYQAGASFIPPDSIDVGAHTVGTEGVYTYYGPADRTGGSASLSISGPNASDFSFDAVNQQSTLDCRWGPFDACTFTVYFTPSATGLRTATIAVSGVGNIPISGTGQ
ncbi:hypothetical protein SAMN05421771_2564 [Granulicella pectinivorans]|uniref:Choice-of-anchor D domain-containing protein n=1 Tax=Granulicella pectinivorans TaxID=474950 RepID=A0A1I6MG89_9BACT|nr:choice-of-anchor D domain-containing protein [Granulicella pectinivorans]SFS14597.1 hypothetical protein SAMN05421771_2564 [Granulicella pectinivorans]